MIILQGPQMVILLSKSPLDALVLPTSTTEEKQFRLEQE